MKRFKGFTFWGKKERIFGLMVALAVVMLLSGCGANAAEINAQTPGFLIITWCSRFLGLFSNWRNGLVEALGWRL